MLVNLAAYAHAWRFTHFSAASARTPAPESLSTADRLLVLFTGVVHPRPVNTRFPADVGLLASRATIGGAATWMIPGKGPDVVVLFHGYGGSKSDLLEEARWFSSAGYSVVAVDFPGSGESPGDRTSLGWSEAEVVNRVAEQVRTPGRLVLFGKSMGSAAVLRAVGVHGLRADALVLENPFDRLVTTVGHRFESMGLPAFPGAQLLVFWGGVQLGYDGFGHDPVAYARTVGVPTLLLHGEDDPRVHPSEVLAIAQALAGPHRVELFPGAAHEGLITADRARWEGAVGGFLGQL